MKRRSRLFDVMHDALSGARRTTHDVNDAPAERRVERRLVDLFVVFRVVERDGDRWLEPVHNADHELEVIAVDHAKRLLAAYPDAWYQVRKTPRWVH